MAGHAAGGYEPVKIDPAITKWDYGLNNSWRTFKFTTVTARQSLVWGVLVPFVVYQIVQTQDLKWDPKGVQRGQPISRWFNPDEESKSE